MLAHEADHTEVGRAVDLWAGLETWLMGLFSDVIGVEIDIGHTIMSSLTAGPKREMLERVVDQTVMQVEIKKRIREICKEFSRLTSQRNRIVHGDWYTLSDGSTYRVGATKELRYFDYWRLTGEDPNNAIFTREAITKFCDDCEKLKQMFSVLASSEKFLKRFPSK